jgi:C1A family cysteine protease/putative cell wall-binding protein
MKRKKDVLIALLLSAGMVMESAIPVMAESPQAGAENTGCTADTAVISDAPDSIADGYIDLGMHVNDEVPAVSENMLGSAAADPSFDLRDEDLVTPVKDQEPYGTCWTFSTVASVESNILKNGYEEDPDLSELQYGWYVFDKNAATQPAGCEKDTVSLMKGQAYGEVGGNAYPTMISLMERRGLTSEGIAPYVGVNSPGYDDSVMAYSSNSYVLSDTDVVSSADIAGAKDLLVTKGALMTQVAYYNGGKNDDGKDYYQDGNDALYNPNGSDSNHGVTIIGWDDNYSRTNFNQGQQPKNDGAWIVKNSWGNYGNHNGYFYLSYEDTTPYRECFSYQVIPASEASDNVYQYDGAGTLDCEGSCGSFGSMESNVFTADKDEILDAVQCFFADRMTRYKVSVYTDVEDVPTSGNLVSSSVTEGVQLYPGYHTISLSSPVDLKAGMKFAVVIQILTTDEPDDQAIFFHEAQMTNYPGVFSEVHAEPGQSYFSEDGKNWEDLASYGNLFVKALTEDDTTKIVTEEPVSGNVGDRSGISFLTTGLGTASWSSTGNLPDGLTLDEKTGMLLGTYEKAGTYTFTVRAENDSGSDERTYTISVGVRRIQGDDRYRTMQASAGMTFPGTCSTVVVASGENWPDALAASVLAGVLECPVVLTGNDTMNTQTHDTVKLLHPANAIIAGGSDAVSDKVRDGLLNLGIASGNVTRIEGADRVETAERIEKKAMENSSADTCIIASGNSYPDALSISAYAYEHKMPILLTEADGTLRDSTLKIAGTFKRAILTGGTDAVSGTLETQLAGAGVSAIRCGGKDRYETSEKIISSLYGDSIPFLAVSTGRNFPDALSGAVLAGRACGAILLVNGSETSGLSGAEAQLIQKSDNVCVLGGTSAVSKEVKSEIDAVSLN